LGAKQGERETTVKLKIAQRSGEFFDLFQQGARNVRAAAVALQDLIETFDDVEAKSHHIKELERDGDEITHSVIRMLNTTFVTPMDREDIYSLASALDDVLDSIDAAADMFVLHKIEEPLPEMKAQVGVLELATEQIERALEILPRMTRDTLEPIWVEVSRLEDEGDHIYRKAVADLFSGEFKAMDVLKWKDIIENVEEAIDGLQRLAHIVEATVLKHA